MEEIKKQVAKARRRMTMQQFFNISGWCFLLGLIVAIIAIAIPKIFAISFLNDTGAAIIWNWIWLGGSLGVALLTAIAITFVKRKSDVQTAIEVDRVFGLRERVSSALALDAEALESDFGKALVEDAAQRVDRVDVPEHFKVRLDSRTIVPVLLVCFAFGIAFGIKNATAESDQTAEISEAEKKRMQDQQEALKKKLDQKLKQAKEKGLKDAELAFRELQSEMDKFDPKDKQSTKKIMSKLSDIKKQLEERQKKLGDSDQVKKQLASMKSIEQGAADKVAKSMKSGDFNKAQDELKKLSDKLANDELTADEKKQLAKQMSDLGEKLDEMSKQQEAAKQELKEQIEQAQRDGDVDKAAKMQQQLDQLERQERQKEQIEKLAQQLKECSNCLGNGEKLSDQQMADAQQAIKELSEQLAEMQQDAEALQAIEDVMQQIGECKNMLAGEGMNESDFDSLAGAGQGSGEGQGDGLGEGQGFGDRPESESKTGFFDTKVAGQTKQGEAILSGKVNGENISGVSKAELRQQIQSSLSEESDPLTDLRLPRSQREHAKEYFEKVRNQ